ncbi:MAG: hypothetical protein ACUVWN_05775 [bacterium]
MAYAYTPGLKVAKRTTLRKIRRLPLPGKILVNLGQTVNANSIVARTELPGQVRSVNVASILGIQPEEIYQYMQKKEGDPVSKDEVLASTKGIFGLFKSQCFSPTDGTVETVSKITGQVMIRGPEIPVEINAYVDGEVVDIMPDEGVIIQTYGSFIQGIFGIGGEAIGILQTLSENPGDIITPDSLPDKMSGKIIVVGALITSELVKRAIKLGVKGIIAGGIDDNDLKALLGYDLGVAITGSENLGITIIITEGFGKMEIASRTYNLLKECEGMKASINGATQIRAGVIRPEIIVSIDHDSDQVNQEQENDIPDEQLRIGSEVRIIREPYFGELAEVIELPIELQKLETEALVRVLKARLKRTNEIIILPRANVEIIN